MQTLQYNVPLASRAAGRLIAAVHRLDQSVDERLASTIGQRPARDAAMARSARHGAKLEVALLLALFAGGAGAPGRRRRTTALRIVAALAMTVAAIEVVSRAVTRSRPIAARPAGATLVLHPPGRSFPSRHAACAAAMTTVALPTARTFGGLMGGLAAALSISRVYAGLHYPSDVVAGWLVGVVVGLAARPRWHAA